MTFLLMKICGQALRAQPAKQHRFAAWKPATMVRRAGRSASFCLLLAASSLFALGVSAPSAEGWNLPVKTMGGTQVWRDTHVYAGWRIQQNILTGHCRLLDDNDVRRAWGWSSACDGALANVRARTGLRPRSRHLVLLVHGIARSPATFAAMQGALREAGYDAVAISYPSTRGSIESHAAGLEHLLDRQTGATTVTFVTHSMGGLIIRHLLARQGAWQTRLKVHGVVQIAPPNKGSAVARWLVDNLAYRLVFGVSGQQLTPDQAEHVPALKHPFAIIAGGKGDGDGYNPLLAGDDDGTVAVSETRLPGAGDFLVVPALHRRIADHPETFRAVKSYLSYGAFSQSNQPTIFRPGIPAR